MQKTSGYFEIYDVSVRAKGERGLSQCEQFVDNGEWSIFRDFVRTSFMDGLLSYCSYKK